MADPAGFTRYTNGKRQETKRDPARNVRVNLTLARLIIVRIICKKLTLITPWSPDLEEMSIGGRCEGIVIRKFVDSV